MILSHLLFRCITPVLLISAGARAATIDLFHYPLLASFQSDGQYNLSGLTTWNGQPVTPANMPNSSYQRELSATFDFYRDLTALNVMYVQVSNVVTTQGAWWGGTAFDNVTLTGLRVSNTDPVTIMGFSNAFANPGQILAAGSASERTSPLQTTPGYTLTQANNQFWVHTVNQADYGFTSLFNITYANRIRGGGVYQFTFAPYINVAGFDFNFWDVQAEYGNSNQFVNAQLVTLTPEPSAYLMTFAGVVLFCGFRISSSAWKPRSAAKKSDRKDGHGVFT